MKTSIQNAILDAKTRPDRSGWESVLGDDLEVLGAVKLEGGVPVRVSVGYPERPATGAEVLALELQFRRDWPGYALGPWQAGDDAEAVATVRPA